MEPKLSIVILNYNTRDLLAQCLQSIERYAPHAETIVVDNASPDGSADMVRRQYPCVRLKANAGNLGFAQGMNCGLALATSPLILTLNADTELLPDTLPPLLKAAGDLPRAGILGPTQYAPDPSFSGATGRQIASAFPDPTLLREVWRLLVFGDSLQAHLRLGPWKGYAGAPRPVAWLMGAALLFRRECLIDIQGFDETHFMYGEDWDICYRARAANWQIYLVPEARILHHENASGKEQFSVSRQAKIMQANLYFHQKHFGNASRRALAAVYCIGGLLRLGVMVLIWPFRSSRAAWLEKWHSQLLQTRLAAAALLGRGD